MWRERKRSGGDVVITSWLVSARTTDFPIQPHPRADLLFFAPRSSALTTTAFAFVEGVLA